MSENTLLRIAQLCVELEQVQAKDALKQILVRAAEAFERPFFLLGVRGVILSTREAVQFAVSNYPQEWQEYYDSNGFVRTDPFLRRALSGWGPFRSDEVSIADTDRAFLARRASVGLAHGMTCTFRTRTGFIGMVSMYGSAAVPKETWPVMSVALNLLCSAITRASAFAIDKTLPTPKAKFVELSGDEKQCLELYAQGLTASQIGEQLNIDERKVRYQLDRVAAKLNVKNKREAVTEALNLGLIHKRHFAAPKFKGNLE